MFAKLILIVLKYSLLMCEFFYFPLHAYLFQWRAVVAPWRHQERKLARRRTLLVGVIRLLYFSSLYFVRGSSILLYYLIAYSISIQIIRFTDAFSHSYEVVPVGTKRRHSSKSYDMLHTYSIAWEADESESAFIRFCAHVTHVLFFLNFNFHTQHHQATCKSWYELNHSFALRHRAVSTVSNETENEGDIMNHHSLYNFTPKQYTIPLLVALQAFHAHRVHRIFGKPGSPTLDPITGRLSLAHCFGVTDASILVLEV